MWDDPKALSGISVTLTVMTATALAAATLASIARMPAFAFREVAVLTPLVRTSAPHLETVIREELAGTFFTMNLEAARSAIGKVAWVRAVSLRRQWPQRLEVSVEEHVPLARWNDTGLLSTLGERFVAAYDGNLPQFRGPDNYAAEMTQRFAEWSATLKPLAIDVVGIEVTPRGGWRLVASAAEAQLTLELGRDDPSARLDRFVAGYARTIGALARQGTRIAHVDLRYRNGFAARVPGFREPSTRRTP